MSTPVGRGAASGRLRLEIALGRSTAGEEARERHHRPERENRSCALGHWKLRGALGSIPRRGEPSSRILGPSGSIGDHPKAGTGNDRRKARPIDRGAAVPPRLVDARNPYAAVLGRVQG